MFNLFKKKKPEMPLFEGLQNSEYKDKYFFRTSHWDWFQEGMIQIFDINAPRVITMDPFPQFVYLEATGQQTVSEFVYSMASQYTARQGIPAQLDLGIIEALESQIKDGLIIISDYKVQLDNSILFPKSEENNN